MHKEETTGYKLHSLCQDLVKPTQDVNCEIPESTDQIYEQVLKFESLF